MPRKRATRLLESVSAPVREATFTAKQRRDAAKAGEAMADGSYPIQNAGQLADAIKAVGRGGADHDKIRAHIIKRAKALGLSKDIPENWGADGSVKEADLSFEDIGSQIGDMLLSATQKQQPMSGWDACTEYPWIKATYPDRVIVSKGAELYQIPYTVTADGDITLGAPQEVVTVYQPVANDTPATEQAEDTSAAAAAAAMEASARPAPAPTGADPAGAGAPVELHETSVTILSEAEDGAKGSAWDVLLIKAGLSGNRRYYPASMLESAVPLFEGARAYADHPSKDEMRNRPERSIRDVVGWFESVTWDTNEQGIRGTFRVLESADWLRATLKSAWDAGKRDLLGFSINAMGTASSRPRADGSTLIEAIEKVVSTDVVTTPGAGGRLLGVLESERSSESEMDPELLKKLIAEAMAAQRTEIVTEVREALRAEGGQAGSAAPAATINGTVTAASSAPVTEAKAGDPTPEMTEMREALATFKTQTRLANIAARVDAAKLPAPHTAKLKARLLEAGAKREVDDAEVDAEIGFVRELLAESGPARPNWPASVAIGDDAADQQKKALQGWFDGRSVDGVQPVRDLKESFVRWTGQSFYDVSPIDFFKGFFTSYDSESDHKRVTEALGSTDWSNVFADVFYATMIRAYQQAPEYDQWRKFVSDIEGPSDFRTRHFDAIGGYGDLQTVPELGTYPELTTPTDEATTYSLAKKGGIESISMEAVLGDRLQQVRRMPQMMAYAAARGLYRFVLDLITTTNPTLGYDSTTLYHANHANTSTTALSVAGVDEVNVAMRSQTARLNTSDILASRARPRYVIVPNELESISQRVLKPSPQYATNVSNAGTDTTVDPMRWANAGIDYHVYDYLTDATDWWAVADPTMMATMVVGFLNGRQEPELFVQDQPNIGSNFSADRIAYKVRFIFGGAILDHRAFYREVVAGG